MGSIGPTSWRLFLMPLLAWCLGVCVVMIGWLVGVDERSVASLLAIGFACLTASLVGQAPVAMVGRGEVDRLAPALLASIMFRGGSTVIGIVVLVKIGLLDRSLGAVGFGLWYATLLVVDVWVASQHILLNFPASIKTTGRA